LVNFYLNQAILLYNSVAGGNSQENHLTAELLKIKEYIEKHPEGCTVRDIKYGIFCLRKCTKPEVEASCKSLIDLKIIRFEANKYYSLGKKDHQDHQLLKTIATQGVEGDDQRSSKDHQDHHFGANFEGVAQSNINSVEGLIKSDVENVTQDDLDDLLMIKDHHPLNHAGEGFRATDDLDDLFSRETEKNNHKIADSTEVVQPVKTALDYIPPSVNAELLRECIADGNWEMVTELTESWETGYKIDVWACLSETEKKAIRELKTPNEPAPLGYDPEKIPLIKETATYWSKEKKCKITVFIISATGDEVQARVEGKKGISSFKFNDLACCEESPISEITVGDRVKIREGKQKGKVAKVSSVVYQTIRLVDEKNKSIRGEFYSHQLEKL
jgi:hypothetical protein